ncbi:FAD-binding oxidoreductase, partial [Halomonas beimenensis]
GERASRVPDGVRLDDPGYRLLAHCTEKTNAPGTPRAWQRIFAAFGLELEVVATGCCGMSGTYGHEARNLATSKAIYAQSWQPRVEDPANAGRLLATGYSCRSQARRLSDTALPHPLQGLLDVLRRAG